MTKSIWNALVHAIITEKESEMKPKKNGFGFYPSVVIFLEDLFEIPSAASASSSC
jgi:hypothetical protein